MRIMALLFLLLFIASCGSESTGNSGALSEPIEYTGSYLTYVVYSEYDEYPLEISYYNEVNELIDLQSTYVDAETKIWEVSVPMAVGQSLHLHVSRCGAPGAFYLYVYIDGELLAQGMGKDSGVCDVLMVSAL